MSKKIVNLNIENFENLATPKDICTKYPITDKAEETVFKYRNIFRNILTNNDDRIVIITGPCSIHDYKAAYEYAEKLSLLQKIVKQNIILIMRVYFEKPRTILGWKGLINDPNLDQSNDINKGLKLARKILLHINELGVPSATEFLDPIVPQYIADLITWASIGARTTESQTHRQMASGLSMPVGFKNLTDGNLDIAINAMVSSHHSHSFLGINYEGHTSIIRTKGNKDVHLVLRGSKARSNYSKADIAYTKVLLEKENYKRLILVDCSHGNSNKNFKKQIDVFNDVMSQILEGENIILGMMLESNLIEGRQNISKNLIYGQSITDPCISWDTTEKLILSANEKISAQKKLI